MHDDRKSGALGQHRDVRKGDTGILVGQIAGTVERLDGAEVRWQHEAVANVAHAPTKARHVRGQHQRLGSGRASARCQRQRQLPILQHVQLVPERRAGERGGDLLDRRCRSGRQDEQGTRGGGASRGGWLTIGVRHAMKSRWSDHHWVRARCAQQRH